MAVLAGALAACNAVLGIGDYQDRVADGGTTDAGDDGTVGADDATDGSSDSSVVYTQTSCNGLVVTCGGKGTGSTNCCESSVVPAGTYSRAGGTATVSAFRLDTYEVTVGRFRPFVAAYAQNMIVPGAGKNPNNASDPGWNVTWNSNLPGSAGALTKAVKCDPTYATWTDGYVNNFSESRPMNCITWFEAEAFCTWDGGRLPTEAEWQYAASGGSLSQTYPWPSGAVPGHDANLAVYGCYYDGNGTCSGLMNIAAVGSVSAGYSKWGQADLAGNVSEWAQDSWDGVGPLLEPCVDCAALIPSSGRVIRGGSFDGMASLLPSAHRSVSAPSTRDNSFGVRCARKP